MDGVALQVGDDTNSKPVLFVNQVWILVADQVIIAVKDALDENPILADKVRFSLIDFSDDAS